ncbi:MAG: PAS domain S-box protein [Desulfobacterales bacterium]|nr:PAS domain S-box protein [Desulfobacterales bacterium]
MKNFIKNFLMTAPGSIKQRLYIQAIVIAVFLSTMIFILIWTGNTLSMITAIARFERTHTVSRLQAKASLLDYINTKNDQAKSSFFKNMAITQSYNKVFSDLLVMRTSKPEEEFVQIIENTFKEADHKTAVAIVHRIKVLYWHPIVKELVGYADKANSVGEMILSLGPLAMAARSKEKQHSILSEIGKAEEEFIFYERSFSTKCSDLANNITTMVNLISIVILIFSVFFTGLITYIISNSLLQQTVRHAQDLKESEERLLLAIKGSNDAPWDWDLIKNKIYYSPQWWAQIGYAPNELSNDAALWQRLMHPDDSNHVNNFFQKALKDGTQSYEVEFRLKHKNDHYVPVLSRGFITRNESGEPIRVSGTNMDLSERKRIEGELRSSEKKYRALFNSINDGICLHEIIYTDNKPIDYRILDINPKYEELTGIKKDNAIGATASILYKADKAPYLDIYAKIAETGESTSFETFFAPMEKHFLISVFSPKKYQFATIFQDITERKKYEAQIQQAQKMEAIGTLAGGIAHDFNNMLGVITGNISYALNNVNQNDELYEILLDVQESSRQAQNLTRQLLTFSKGGAPIKKVSNINNLINDSAYFSTRGSKANLHFELLNDLWLSDVDEGQINQVIGNLIINANQAMPNGGTITIRTDNTEIEADSGIPLSAGRYIKIVIEDQGIGISKKHLPKIFEPYYTTKQKGSGLGLATAYSIIKRHGGHITVYSEIEKGTVFNIYLPASSEDIDDIPNKEGHKHTGQGKILIMDDQDSILKMVSRMLHKMGYEVMSATDGSQAIEIYRESYNNQNPFDLVILDLTVPGGMGGAKTIPELLKIDPKVKAVVSSGYSNDPIMGNYEYYGFCGVVPKPYTKDQLAEVLNNILFGKKD